MFRKVTSSNVYDSLIIHGRHSSGNKKDWLYKDKQDFSMDQTHDHKLLIGGLIDTGREGLFIYNLHCFMSNKFLRINKMINKKI